MNPFNKAKKWITYQQNKEWFNPYIFLHWNKLKKLKLLNEKKNKLDLITEVLKLNIWQFLTQS